MIKMQRIVERIKLKAGKCKYLKGKIVVRKKVEENYKLKHLQISA